MQTRFKRIFAGGIAAALLTAAVGGAAFAQTPTAAGTPKPIQQRAEELLSSLAGKLGKSPAELRAAIVATQKDRVAADLAAGRITPEQATRLNQRIDASNGLDMFRGPAAKGAKATAKPGAPAKAVRGNVGADLATFLGVQPQELRQAVASGKSLAAFAAEKGKSRDDVKAFLTTRERTRLAAAVTAGRITQAQSDQRLTRFTSQIDQLIDRTAPAGKPRPGGRGHRGAPGPATATPTPA